MKRPQKVVHAILKPHHPDIADNHFPLLPEGAVGLHGTQAVQLNPIAHNRDTRFGHTAALHFDFLVRLVCRDDVIGQAAREFLQQDEHVINEQAATARKARSIHFRGQVVMVKDKALAKQLVKACNQNKRVRWIVSVDNIKTIAEEDQQGKYERGSHGVAVLPKVPEETIRWGRRRVTIYLHTLHGLPRGLPWVRWTDDRNLVACSAQRHGFPADARILGIRPILQQHQNSLLGGLLHNYPLPGHRLSWRTIILHFGEQSPPYHLPSIMFVCGFALVVVRFTVRISRFLRTCS